MSAWRQWLAAGNYVERAQQDFPQQVRLLRRFLIQKGHVNEAGGIDLSGIQEATLSDYQSFVYDYVSPKTGKPLSTQTQIHALAYVKSFFRFLQQSGRMAFNPAKVIRLPRSPRRLPVDLLTPEEMRRLLQMPDLATPCGFRDRVILELFWCTGMRISELLSLSPSDIDFEQELVLIRQGKGGKPRRVPLGKGVAAWLGEYLSKVRPWLALNHHAQKEGEQEKALFLNRYGEHMDKSGLSSKICAAARRAGLTKPVTTHTFRHMLATSMLKAGADLRHIQEILGHTDITTTQRYLHVVKADLKRVHSKTHPREVHANAHGERKDVDYRGERFL